MNLDPLERIDLARRLLSVARALDRYGDPDSADTVREAVVLVRASSADDDDGAPLRYWDPRAETWLSDG